MLILFSLLLVSFFTCSCASSGISPALSIDEVLQYRSKVKEAFDFAYTNYMKHAYGFDELKPITCTGIDTWGGFSLTLIDALDTLAIMGEMQEFRRVYSLILDTFDFERDVNVSVFETNIRVIGGLVSAHLLSQVAGVPDLPAGFPCEGPLLSLAVDLAHRILPAFATSSGLPFGTVNLVHGVPQSETPVTCTAGVGTFIIEFATLSRLTGDDIFEETAMRAVEAMHATRSHIDLLGNHINTTDKKWIAVEAGIGGGVDSFFEYLVKGSIALHEPRLMDIFYTYYDAINKYIKKDDWFFMVHKDSGYVTVPAFQSLEAFWPGLLTLIGRTEQGKKSLYNYHQIARQFGFLPELFDVSSGKTKGPAYPLRPEYVESLFYLYRATRDPHLLSLAAEVLEAINFSCRTECGYATVHDVNTHSIEDRMESFFLSETLKYLYLLFTSAIEEHAKKKGYFDPRRDGHFILRSGGTGRLISVDNLKCVIDSGGYVFNTEAHPIDIAALDCCQSKHFRAKTIAKMHSSLKQDGLEESDSSPQPDLHQIWLPSSSRRVYAASLDDLEEDEDSTTCDEEGEERVDQSASPSSHLCHIPSDKETFLQIVSGKIDPEERSLFNQLVDWPSSSSFAPFYLRNNCDFDLLTCPIERRFSRYNRYGQVG